MPFVKDPPGSPLSQGLFSHNVAMPVPSKSPSGFIIVFMMTGTLMGRRGMQPILAVIVSMIIDTMLNFDSCAHGDVMCKQSFRLTTQLGPDPLTLDLILTTPTTDQTLTLDLPFT